jgi:hypothetical protein
MYNNFELVQMLVGRGANINARNREGHTALSIAQANGNVQISNFLSERGADLGMVNHAQQTPQQTPQQTQSGGITNLMDTQIIEFQPGAYRLSGGNRDLRFAGNANFGTVNFINSGRVVSGSYQTAGGNLILIVDGRTFTYKIESGISFSGHGEVWVRTGN